MNLRQLTAALPSDDARRSPAAELAMVTAMQHLVFAALDSGINNRQQGCVFWLANFFNAESTYWSNQWMIKQLQYPQLNDPQFFLIKMFLEFVPPIETVFRWPPQMWSDRCHHARLLSAAWQQWVELGGIRCHCFGCVWKWGYPADTPNGHFNIF